MNYKVSTIPVFDKRAKRLAKKYSSFQKDLSNLSASLVNDPEQGVFLGNGFYKIRFAITSKGKGKSGGAIIITYVKVKDTMVYLAYIYDKSDKENISDKELEAIFNLIP